MHEWIAADPQGKDGGGVAATGADTRPVLYCFHHAGGSAPSYNAWRRDWLADSRLRFVELPGRPGAQVPLPYTEVEALMPELLRAFAGQAEAGVPYAFYGHSLGALVAYRLTRALAAEGHPQPAFLAVSGRRSPTCPLPFAALWNLPEDALIDALRALGGIPETLLASAKWRRLFLPCMRADLRLSDEYLEAQLVPLTIPAFGLRGEDDPIVSPRELGNWRGITSNEFEQGTLPGAHFFSAKGTRRLQQRLQAMMADMARPRAQQGELCAT
jgi:medium-chain acyl-[acyl-carrier-protein] hydrolase